jgi:Sec-independent protein translocase protein TatA
MNALLKTIDEVKREMREIERELEDDTLPHSDQALLQDAWDALEERLDKLEEELWDAEREEEQERLNEGMERTPTPHPPELIRLGEGFYVTPEELERMNKQVDDRGNGPIEIGACGFACDGHCQTCEGGYDPSGEV